MKNSIRTVILLLLLAASSFIHVFADDPPSDVVKKAAKADADAQRKKELAQEEEAARKVRTKTPIGPGAPTPIGPGRFELPPAIPGRTVYNCLEWGFCRRLAWAQPTNVTIESMLAAEGFDTSISVDCKTCPAQHIILLVYHVPPGGCPSDPAVFPSSGSWVHAIKKINGKYSSKNGASYFYPEGEITDVDAFINTHYPAPPGKELCIRCYAKP